MKYSINSLFCLTIHRKRIKGGKIMKIRKITIGAMCLALSLLLPQVFHMIGMQEAGSIFLPMHLPVFIAGMVLVPIYGLLLGVLAPLTSFALTGMPGIPMMFFMIGELATYGVVSGLMFYNFKMNEKKFGSIISLLVAMVAGRVIYGFLITIGASLFNLHFGTFYTVLLSVATGLPGIVTQLVLVPLVVIAVNKTNVLHIGANA